MLLKDIDPRLRGMIINAIRMWFVRTTKYGDVKKKARVEKPTYKKDGSISKRIAVSYRCKKCGGLFKTDEINIDHIFPVVALSNSTSTMTLSQYVKKVDCPISNLQVLCSNGKDSCHSKKTALEKKNRVKRNRVGGILKTYKKPIKKIRKIKL